MRQTFTQLQTTSKDYISQSSGSVSASTIANFIKEHINKKYHFIQAELRNFISLETAHSITTVADTQFYWYPSDVVPPIESATMEIASVKYPLVVVHSQMEWDRINQIDFSGTTIPQYIFPRRDDFGIYPTPSSAVTVTLVAPLADRDMTIEDFTDGTVTVTNADATITQSATGFTAAQVGRWFQTTDDGFWYRIASNTSSSVHELARTFEGTTAAGASYTIGESPELPPELHELIPHGVAAEFFSGPRKDFVAAQAHNNYFMTGDFNNSDSRPSRAKGGLLAAKRRYASRDNSAIVNKNTDRVARFDERFSTTLS